MDARLTFLRDIAKFFLRASGVSYRQREIVGTYPDEATLTIFVNLIQRIEPSATVTLSNIRRITITLGHEEESLCSGIGSSSSSSPSSSS